MRFFSKSGQYFWDIDRFHLFTESEKCSFLEALTSNHNIWKYVDKSDDGITGMLSELIKEVEESLKHCYKMLTEKEVH